jgi:hypothetical protein
VRLEVFTAETQKIDEARSPEKVESAHKSTWRYHAEDQRRKNIIFRHSFLTLS